ncbi:hypothetical protein GTQ45_01880 [Pyruvatibacter mobilis]|uniref:Uncharacterized protein n=1 Tax=Pyruvatibacter mobilis TaxID=1712261 RepID=A0A845Q8B4_9HYPH|nr:hypothetical protein [Pyruvatibacter mobilis]NBG94480.1 hypothetical protein [Pyruvatibacter mobilis]QJD74001.1 hypothetical protein HG718_00430 [Pyruvatibacter mobilis]GGD03278.1 hypothetical protein GCM10011587_03750 [Pyruvatibacter mobilis]
MTILYVLTFLLTYAMGAVLVLTIVEQLYDETLGLTDWFVLAVWPLVVAWYLAEGPILFLIHRLKTRRKRA